MASLSQKIDFVALDIETTGLDSSIHNIMEIAAIRFKQGRYSDEFSCFIKQDKPLPLSIKQLTGINDEDLENGEDLVAALQNLKEFVGDDYLVCHNSPFDIGFIDAHLEKLQIEVLNNMVFDTLELARIYLPFIANHKLITVCEFLEIDLKGAHRAIHDAKATAEVFVKLLDFIEEHITITLNRKLFQLSQMAMPQSGLEYLLDLILKHQKQEKRTRKRPYFFRNNWIEHSPAHSQSYEIDSIFGKEGVFAGNFPAYEHREGQIEMAYEVLNAFQNDEFLVVEAGTGVGKSLAYLIPALMISKELGVKIIISTNTKNLQEQLFYKDLPLVQDSVSIPFKATLLKGRGNYVCERRWQESVSHMLRRFSPFEARVFLYLLVWHYFTLSGDISENTSFSSKRHAGVWKSLVADGLFCYGKRCEYYNRCFLMSIRRKAEQSNLVIINHYLLLADLQAENSVLGKYEYLIVDEAHNLPHIAPSELGISLSFADFNRYFSQLFAVKTKYQSGMLADLKAALVKSELPKDRVIKIHSEIDKACGNIQTVSSELQNFFMMVSKYVQEHGSYKKYRIRNDSTNFLQEHIGGINQKLASISADLNKLHGILKEIDESAIPRYEIFTEHFAEAIESIDRYYEILETLSLPDYLNYAFWVNGGTSDKYSQYPDSIINYAPLNIEEILYDKLYSRLSSLVMTSATLAIRGAFKYFTSRMGLDAMREERAVQECIVKSSFSYKDQALVIVASFLPTRADKRFIFQSSEMIDKAVDYSQLGTMVLFTSYNDLNTVYDNLGQSWYEKNISTYVQGKGTSRSEMLNEFRKKKNAVLLGTNSFWEGVDIPGESLSILVLFKLPFMVPSEPIVEAYLEKLQAENKNPFMNYMLPNALLRYKQGFGRLIRTNTDKGIVLVLDSRISTKEYGRYFIETIPAETVIAKTPEEVIDKIGHWLK